MSRKARIEASGALHHLIVSGIERKPIFRDSADYASFAERLGDLITEIGTSCYPWALMNNQVHLLLGTGHAPLSTIMRRLLSWYAQHFNRRRKRYGHLFQNRYESFLCEKGPYLLELVRYIHLNSLRAGSVRDIHELNGFAWTRHAVIMAKVKNKWQDVEGVRP